VSASSYTIRSYRPGDEVGILQLLNEVFAEDNPDYTPRTMAQWRWEYEQNPCGHEIVVAEEEGGRIVGHYACLPARARIRDRIVQCGQGVDSMVSRDYRGGLKSEGMFLRTARYYFAKHGVPAQNAYGYGFPNKKALRVGVRMLAYAPVFAPVPALARNLFEHDDDTDVASGASAASRRQVVALDRLDERADRLWDRLVDRVQLGIVRDARYLSWRYLDCAHGRYLVFGRVDESGEIRGLYVARENWTGPPILALAELLVPEDDPETIALLLAHAVSEARTRRQQRVELWCRPGSRTFQCVSDHGFKVEDSPFNLCIKPYEDGLQLDWIKNSWYFSLGDGDVF
jgi:hypothetical protein